MKTKLWILLLAGLLALCLGLSLLLLRPDQAAFAQVYCQGELIYTLPLQVDTQVRVESPLGVNEITVRGGAVAVTGADCPDGYCMQRGFCRGGPQIVCLPNRVVIVFLNDSGVDAVVG